MGRALQKEAGLHALPGHVLSLRPCPFPRLAAGRRPYAPPGVRRLDMGIRFSRDAAFVLGVLTPAAETIRRWSTWREDPAAYFDDFFLAGLLLYGAWRVLRDPRAGQRFLAAGWGFACGMIYPSFFTQLYRVREGLSDPAPISAESVLIIKGVGFAVAILSLVLALRPLPESQSQRPTE